MDEPFSQPAQEIEPELLTLEFRGTGREFFRIWIVNLALTLLTIGIYGPWAKVRTWRYFYANTYLGGHPFDYHASPVRILIGRAIALTLFLGYSLTAGIYPKAVGLWFIVFIFGLPWLANASIRFNARNSSYRNVRFNFTGSYSEALGVYIGWPLAAAFTLYTLWPRARKARDYYYVNMHTFGGRYFETEFSNWAIYRIYLLGILILILVGGAVGVSAAGLAQLIPPDLAKNQQMAQAMSAFAAAAIMLSFVISGVFIETMVFNLAIGHTKLDGRHELRAKLGVLRMAWIYLTNVILMLLTLGLFYPWAAVRLARYRRSRISILAKTSLDEFTSEVIATQSAVGEEIAGFFDLGFGL